MLWQQKMLVQPSNLIPLPKPLNAHKSKQLLTKEGHLNKQQLQEAELLSLILQGRNKQE
jgi:hypothetical protein